MKIWVKGDIHSRLSNKRGGWNKREGGAKDAKSINVEVVILQLESSPLARYLKQFLCNLRKNTVSKMNGFKKDKNC